MPLSGSSGGSFRYGLYGEQRGSASGGPEGSSNPLAGNSSHATVSSA